MSDVPGTPFQSPVRALSGSLLIHALALLLLIAWNSSRPAPASPMPKGRVVLVVPVPLRSRTPSVRKFQAGSAPVPILPAQPLARTFRAPSVSPLPASPQVTIPVADVLHLNVSVSASELPRSEVNFAPPPPKLNNLADASPPVPKPDSQPVVKAGHAFDAAPAGPAAAPVGVPIRGRFGDASAAAPATPNRGVPPASPITPVEILSKPRPAYTEEARSLRIQGEVLLQVLFEASGEVRIDRVVRGLGHGLDESAMAAARGIRFHPARREGLAVDFEATVHIVFELAY